MNYTNRIDFDDLMPPDLISKVVDEFVKRRKRREKEKVENKKEATTNVDGEVGAWETPATHANAGMNNVDSMNKNDDVNARGYKTRNVSGDGSRNSSGSNRSRSTKAKLDDDDYLDEYEYDLYGDLYDDDYYFDDEYYDDLFYDDDVEGVDDFYYDDEYDNYDYYYGDD